MPASHTLSGSNQTTWRGESGTRYPAIILGITEAVEAGPRPDVGLAVSRPRGFAHQVIDPAERITRAWLSGAVGAKASEIHVVTCRARDAARVAADLRGAA